MYNGEQNPVIGIFRVGGAVQGTWCVQLALQGFLTVCASPGFSDAHMNMKVTPQFSIGQSGTGR